MKWSNLSNSYLTYCTEFGEKMGVSDEQIVMLTGFAGGLGLSGKAFGLLCAAIWLNTMKWSQEIPKAVTYKYPYAKKS